MAVHTYNPSYSEGRADGSWPKTSMGKSERLYLKNKLRAKGLGACFSSGRALA
jgi:hypothetical protein